jgi:HlyD family secretion protein
LKRKTRIIGGLAVLGIVILIGSRFFRPQKKESPYRLVAVDRGNITMTVAATGTVSAVTTVQVGSQVSGIISRLHADFNSRVKKGQLLAELDPTPFEQAVEQRKADLQSTQVNAANAQIAFRRQQRLLADGLAAQADFDNAKAAADAALAQVKLSRAALAQAQTNLGYTKIYSPVDGVVVNRAYDVGQTVAASFQAPTLFTIAQDLTKMQVQADVDESDIGRVRVGEPAHFTVDAFPEREFTARVSQVRLNATVNQNVVTYPVIIEVANPDGELRPSMTANVTIDVATVKNTLRVPNAALRFRPPVSPGGAEEITSESSPPAGGLASALPRANRARGPVVYLLAAGNRLRPVAIRTGITDGQWTEVVSGELKPGEPVVAGLATAKAPSRQGPRMRF